MRPLGRNLVLALSYAVGTEPKPLVDALTAEVSPAGFSLRLIHLIEEVERYFVDDRPIMRLLERYAGTWEYESGLMEIGTRICEKRSKPDALARMAWNLIEIELEEQDEASESGGTVFLVRSLKRPEEVRFLRQKCGEQFFMISMHSSHQRRMLNLKKSLGRRRDLPSGKSPAAIAEELIRRDLWEDEERPGGQHLDATFPEADYFVDVDNLNDLRAQVKRFAEMVFGYPFHTPTKAEFAMHHASSAQKRSSSGTRQVGCAVADPDGSIVVVGTNEVPKAHGGLYWEGDLPDGRDFMISPGDPLYAGRDPSYARRKDILQELVQFMLCAQRGKRWSNASKYRSQSERLVEQMLSERLFARRAKYGVLDVGRAVHAEMDALMTAARRGVAVRDCELYCTTFPCHNCAKHIVAAGISAVYFIWPYRSSITEQLWHDSIEVDPPADRNSDKIAFRPFVGVAPRRYLAFFEMGQRVEHDHEDRFVSWSMSTATNRFAAPSDD